MIALVRPKPRHNCISTPNVVDAHAKIFKLCPYVFINERVSWVRPVSDDDLHSIHVISLNSAVTLSLVDKSGWIAGPSVHTA